MKKLINRMPSPPFDMLNGRLGSFSRRCPGQQNGATRTAPNIGSTSGMALVIVLGMLALIVMLVIAFVSSVSTELQSSKSYANESGARSLADSAVNIVIAQVQDATTTPSLAWASQPGMIRTYNVNGESVKAFKLYSSGTLQVTGAFDTIAGGSADAPSTWGDYPAMYVDLNKPVAVGGKKRYPIIDPAAVGTLSSGSLALDGTSTPIEGCFLNAAAPVATVTTGSANQLPMPVQWLYVLKSGTIASVSPDPLNPSAGVVNGASKSDPVVGRIAFWTDDETCKVNVNTASEGTFWDRPFADGATTGIERTLSTSMPVSNEFQRYPGHPATTSLSTVFPQLAGETAVDYKERIYRIIPRVTGSNVNGYGSKSATLTVTGTSKAIVNDTDRLFASLDEFMFNATTMVSGTRLANPKSSGSNFTPDDLEKTRFFLTTSSEAPEVNLFNKPRITLWPLQSSPLMRTAKEKLIAFCSTIGSKPYYFQRFSTYLSQNQDPAPSSQSPTADWTEVTRNQELYTYLQTLTSLPIPGLGGKLAATSGTNSKYLTPVRDQILTEMVDYVRSGLNTFNTNVAPNYSYVPFNASGWVKGQSQVVPLEIKQSSYTTKGFGRFSTITQASLIFYSTDLLVNSGSDTAVVPPFPHHMAAVMLLQPFNPAPGAPPWSANVRYTVEGLDGLTISSGTTSVSPNLSFPATATNLVDDQEGYYDCTALTGLEVCTRQWPSTPKTLGNSPTGAPGVYPFYSPPVQITGSTFNLGGASITIKIYPGYPTIPLDDANLIQTIHMTFPPATNLPAPQVAIASGTTFAQQSSENKWASFNYRMSHNGDDTTGGAGWGVNNGFQHNLMPYIRNLDTVRSVQARYMGPSQDFRVIAGLKDIPATYFEGHGMIDPPTDNLKYTGTTANERLMHSLRVYVSNGNEQTGKSNGFYPNSNNATGLTYVGTTRGHARLLAAATVLDPIASGGARPSRAPVAPQGLTGAYMTGTNPWTIPYTTGTILGDWDTGPGNQIDGPYINKADEGNSNLGYYNLGGNTTGGAIIETGASYSPNRQIASAVAFGSLPSGIDPSNPSTAKPWQTLLFCKNPAAGSIHPGFGTAVSGTLVAPPYKIPPDHAFLDLFTMPVVEPYAISQPFSTAGKVNMNYQIVPFTYLTRDTAVRAVLKSTNIMAIPTGDGRNYKSGTPVDSMTPPLTMPPDYRYTINPNEKDGTLEGFERRFNPTKFNLKVAPDIFRSASEICDIALVPQYLANTTTPAPATPKYSTMDTWWLGGGILSGNGFKLTGDNLREQPYGQLYPRLTTKSNTFTVHVMTQSLKKVPGTAQDRFVDKKDQVTGEFRGSFVVQRYLDPTSDSLVDINGKPATETNPDAMVGPYKFRVVGNKRFAP